jgi:predicted DNA-binding protein
MAEDDTLSSMVSPELLERLKSLSARSGRSLDDCVRQAVAEFCDTWEEYHDTVDSILRNEDARQRALRVVND